MGRMVPFSEKEKAYIHEHLPRSTCAQVARELGRGKSGVAKYAKRNGIHYDQGKVEQIKAGDIKPEKRGKEWRKKISESRKEIFRKERMRLKWGLAQRTRLSIDRMPRKTKDVRLQLKYRCDYVLEDIRHSQNANPYNIYYDSETRRSPNEAYFAEKYGFKFIPLDE